MSNFNICEKDHLEIDGFFDAVAAASRDMQIASTKEPAKSDFTNLYGIEICPIVGVEQQLPSVSAVNVLRRVS